MRYRIVVTLPDDSHLRIVLGGLLALTRTENIVGARILVERLEDGFRNGHRPT